MGHSKFLVFFGAKKREKTILQWPITRHLQMTALLKVKAKLFTAKVEYNNNKTGEEIWCILLVTSPIILSWKYKRKFYSSFLALIGCISGLSLCFWTDLCGVQFANESFFV